MAEIPELWDVAVGIASLLGTCLAILTFYLQYGSRIRRAISGRGPFSGKIVALNALFSGQVSKIQNIRFVSGCTLALLAALLWSISYNSFRSDALADLDPLWVSATIAFFGAITIFVLALLASIRERGKLDAPILRPLFTKNGAVIVFANAFEFWFFLLAVTLTTAGNTIALLTCPHERYHFLS